MNKDKLMGVIRGHGDTQSILAKAMDIGLSTLCSKISGKKDFRQSEIAYIKDRYNLSSEDVIEIFFA